MVQRLPGLKCVLETLSEEIEALSAEDKAQIARSLSHRFHTELDLGLDAANCYGYISFMLETTPTRSKS